MYVVPMKGLDALITDCSSGRQVARVMSHFEHDDGMEQFLSYSTKRASIRTHHEESVDLKGFSHRLKRKLGATMSAWIHRSDNACENMLDKVREARQRNGTIFRLVCLLGYSWKDHLYESKHSCNKSKAVSKHVPSNTCHWMSERTSPVLWQTIPFRRK